MDRCYLGRVQRGVGVVGAEAVCCASCADQGDLKQKDEPGLTENAPSTLDISFEVTG